MLIAFVSSIGNAISSNKAKSSSLKLKDNEKQVSLIETGGKNFKTVKIGKQIWMAENMNESTYRNGDSIPQVQDAVKWCELGTGAFCYYENKAANGAKYGKLYNWYAVNDPRGLAPKGWHIPNDAEWKQLTDYLGGENEAGTKLKSNSGWNEYEGKNGNGNNSSGFAGLPGGFRDFFGPFHSMGCCSSWWSSTEENMNSRNGIFRFLSYNCKNVFKDNFTKRRGISVRCIKD